MNFTDYPTHEQPDAFDAALARRHEPQRFLERAIWCLECSALVGVTTCEITATSPHLCEDCLANDNHNHNQ